MKSLLKYFFSKTGYHIIKRRKFNGSTEFKIEEFNYAVVTPVANYSPWFEDVEFQKIYSQIKRNTLVDIYRCYELWQLVEKVNNIDKSAGFIEIGVWKGGTAAIMGRKLSLLNSNCNFYLADTFSGVVKVTEKDTFYHGGEHKDTSPEIVNVLLKDTYHKYKILKGIFPEETSELIPDMEKFKFCHIDVDIYQSAKDIVDWIWDKLIVGGIIVFDDYGFHTCTGITRYINEQKNMTDRIIIHNLNGHAVMIKLN